MFKAENLKAIRYEDPLWIYPQTGELIAHAKHAYVQWQHIPKQNVNLF